MLATQDPHRGLTRSRTFRHDLLQHEALFLQKFPSQCRWLVAALLRQRIENIAFLIDGAPHEIASAIDLHDHFVEVPNAVGATATPANVCGDRRTELVGPSSGP